MKRLMGILMAVGLLVSPVGQAFACFDVGGLTLSVYNATDAEVGYNLDVDLATHDFGSTPMITVEIDKSAFSPSLTWANLSAGIYGYSGTADNHVFFATTETMAPAVSTRSWAAFMGADDQVKAYYDTQGNKTPASVLASDVASYWTKMDSAATPGQYAGLNVDFLVGEANLGDLATAGHVDMYLYKVNRVTGVVTGTGTDYQCVVRIQAGTPLVSPVIVEPIADETATVGQAYTGPAPALSEGTAPFVWELVSGPAGMVMGNPATGAVAWPSPVANTPPEDPYVITLRATNDSACDDTVSFNLNVEEAPPPWGAASTVGAEGATGSAAANALASLLGPLGILVAVRLLRRRDA